MVLKMSYQSVPEWKFVSRNIAIALGIICIILAVVLVGAIATYTSLINGKDNTIASKDSTITDLNSRITSKNSVISSLNSEISSKDSQIQTLTSEKNEFQAIANLEKSQLVANTTVSIPAGYDRVWTLVANYAGYLEVKCQALNTTGNYVWVIYSSHGVDYDTLVDLVTDGKAVFPILPSTSIEIRVGSELSVASSVTLTIIFYY